MKPVQFAQVSYFVHAHACPTANKDNHVYFKTFKPRSDKRDFLAIKVKSEIFTEKDRLSYCEQLQKIIISLYYLYK